jgi:hypothetical protein
MLNYYYLESKNALILGYFLSYRVISTFVLALVSGLIWEAFTILDEMEGANEKL